MHNIEDGDCVPLLQEINLQHEQRFFPSYLWIASHFQLLWQSTHLLAGNSVLFCSCRLFARCDLIKMTWLDSRCNVTFALDTPPLSASMPNEKNGSLGHWCKASVAHTVNWTTHTCPEPWQANQMGQIFCRNRSIPNHLVPIYWSLAILGRCLCPMDVQRIPKDNNYPSCPCSPCCHLANHTEIFSAVSPDQIFSFLRLHWLHKSCS